MKGSYENYIKNHKGNMWPEFFTADPGGGAVYGVEGPPIRTPLRIRMLVSCVCRVCRGPCDEPITRSEEYYRVSMRVSNCV
jgi:hypothetical protein